VHQHQNNHWLVQNSSSASLVPPLYIMVAIFTATNIRFIKCHGRHFTKRQTLVAIKLFSGVNMDSVEQHFQKCDCDYRNHCLDHERACFTKGFNTALKLSEEKFNSALRQPTKQGSEPTEICPFFLALAKCSFDKVDGRCGFRACKSQRGKLLPY